MSEPCGYAQIPGDAGAAEVMDSAEVAMAKRRQKLAEILEHGDPFTGRFLVNFRDIVFHAKKLLSGERINMNPWIVDGINGSRILRLGAPWDADLKMDQTVLDMLRKHLSYWNINYSVWKDAYSFESFHEMVKEVVAALLSCPNVRLGQETVKELEVLSTTHLLKHGGLEEAPVSR